MNAVADRSHFVRNTPIGSHTFRGRFGKFLEIVSETFRERFVGVSGTFRERLGMPNLARNAAETGNCAGTIYRNLIETILKRFVGFQGKVFCPQSMHSNLNLHVVYRIRRLMAPKTNINEKQIKNKSGDPGSSKTTSPNSSEIARGRWNLGRESLKCRTMIKGKY
jgi:hypothetical protein